MTSSRPTGFVVVRTPIEPTSTFLEWGRDLRASGLADPSRATQEDLEADRQTLRGRMAGILERPAIQAAIRLASPSLWSTIDSWRQRPASAPKAERALVRYLTRSTTRSTPFGLFAGISLGVLGGRTHLAIGSAAESGRRARLDFAVLQDLARHFEGRHRGRFTVRPNSSLYRAGGRIRYAEARDEGGHRSYELMVMDTSPYLDRAIDRARPGALPGEIVDRLVELDVSHEEAQQYVADLIGAQVLVADLDPAMTADRPLERLVDQLTAAGIAAAEVAPLLELGRRIEAVDRAEPDRLLSALAEVEDACRQLPVEVELGKSIQVDLFRRANALAVGPDLLGPIERAVEALRRTMPPEQRFVSRFAEEFQRRYEEREVPLVEALDEEIGIGLGGGPTVANSTSPLMDGIPLAGRAASAGDAWSARERYLLRRLQECARSDRKTLDLSDRDLEALAGGVAPLPMPDGSCVVARIARSAGPPPSGWEVCFDIAVGPPALSLLGRFSDLDPELRRWMRAQIEAEERSHPGAVVAEIVHRPEGHVGNVAWRGELRDFEIPYLASSSRPAEHRIPVDDLLVSVRGGRVVLRSRRLGREVLPRLTNAHNYSWGLPTYRFLCGLQKQGNATAIAWRWGALESLDFLPRVVHGGVVLALARWTVETEELRKVPRSNHDERFRTVQRIRRRLDLPRFVAYGEGENDFVVDLDNVLSVESLCALSTNRASIELREVFPPLDRAGVEGPDGSYANDLLIPYRPTAAPSAPAPARAVERHLDVPRVLPPGSDWLFAKIYTGDATADRIVRNTLWPLATDLLSKGHIASWFFLRYGDPDWHIRIRFRSSAGSPRDRVQPRLESALAPLLEEGLIWKWQYDTYFREVERYGGGTGVLCAEEAFCHDSIAVAQLLELLEEDPDRDLRWQFALLGSEALIDDFSFDPARRGGLLESMRNSYHSEFEVSTPAKKALGDKFRRHRPTLESMLARGDGRPSVRRADEVLRERSTGMRRIADAVRDLERRGEFTTTIEDFVRSLVHVHMFRILQNTHRAHELVLYDFLWRIHEARAARARSASRDRPARSDDP